MWRVTPGQALVSRQWGDERVLFNSLSGATHLLGPGEALLLDVLGAGPAVEEELAAALSAEFEIDAAELPAELDAMLDTLARLDLVEPC